MNRPKELSSRHRLIRAITLSALVAALAAAVPVGSFAQGRNPGKDDHSSPKREETKREEPRRQESRPDTRREEPRREEPRRFETPAPRREEPRYTPSAPRQDMIRTQPAQRQDNWQSPVRRVDSPAYQPRQDRNTQSDQQSNSRQDWRRDRPGTGDVRPQHDSYVPRQPRTGDTTAYNRPDPAPQNPIVRRDPPTDGRGPGYRYGIQNPVLRPGDAQSLPESARFGRPGIEQAPRTVPGSRPPFAQVPQTGAERIRDRRISPERVRPQVLFTQSREGRNFRNGVTLRPRGYIPPREVQVYYRDYCYYPYYYPRYEPTVVYYSPFSDYTGVCAPYIYRDHCVRAAPPAVWIDLSFNTGGGSADPSDDYYLSRPRDSVDLDDIADPELRDAVDSLRQTFLDGNIEAMVDLIDPDLRIAVFHKGRYDYSLPSNDYLDMTRDALRSMETEEFRIQRVARKDDGVYSVSAVHVYRDRNGESKAVGLGFVFERIHDRWTLTQVGSAPER